MWAASLSVMTVTVSFTRGSVAAEGAGIPPGPELRAGPTLRPAHPVRPDFQSV